MWTQCGINFSALLPIPIQHTPLALSFIEGKFFFKKTSYSPFRFRFGFLWNRNQSNSVFLKLNCWVRETKILYTLSAPTPPNVIALPYPPITTTPQTSEDNSIPAPDNNLHTNPHQNLFSWRLTITIIKTTSF